MLTLDPTLSGKSKAQGKLIKVTMKQDGDSQNTLDFGVSIVFRIASSADAAQADKIVPGALIAYERATDEGNDWKSRFLVDPHFTNVRLQFADPARPETEVQEFAASCRKVGLRCSKKAVALEYGFNVGGQPPGVAASFAALLGRTVEVTVGWENVLPFTRPGPLAGPAHVLDTNTLVSAEIDGDEVHGFWLRVATEAESQDYDLLIRDLDGTEHGLSEQDIVAVQQLTDHKDNTKLIADYKAKCKKLKVAPSASALLLALAQDGGAEKSDAGTWNLTAATITHAVQLTSQPLQRLPPEPGDGEESKEALG